MRTCLTARASELLTSDDWLGGQISKWYSPFTPVVFSMLSMRSACLCAVPVCALCPFVRCARLCAVPVCALCPFVHCACLCAVPVCALCLFVRCARLCAVPVCALCPFVRCACSCAVPVCALCLFVRCACLCVHTTKTEAMHLFVGPRLSPAEEVCSASLCRLLADTASKSWWRHTHTKKTFPACPSSRLCICVSVYIPP